MAPRHLVLSLTAAAVLLALAGTYALRDDAAAPAAAAPAGAGPWAHAGLRPGVEPAAPAAPAPGPAAAPPVQPPAAAELCGLGTVKPPADGGEQALLARLPAPVGRHALDEARQGALRTLAAGDARQRAAAWLLAQPEGDGVRAEDSAAWAGGFVAEALATRDPQALRWAGQACRFMADGPACRHALVRARVQAEPANAVHWVDWAHEEPAAAEAAWAGLQQAGYWRDGTATLAGAVRRGLPPQLPGYLSGALLVDASGREAAMQGVVTDLVDDRCAAPGGPEQAACDRLAHLMLERSDSVLTLWQGRKLAKRLGWPEATLQAVEQEVRSLTRAWAEAPPDEGRLLGCPQVQALQAQVAAFEQDGELAALRRRAAERPSR